MNRITTLEIYVLEPWQDQLQHLQNTIKKSLALFVDLNLALASGLALVAIMPVQAAEMVPLTIIGHKDSVDALAWAPDGRSLASGSWDKTIKIWDAASWSELRTLTGHKNYVRALAWRPDGQRLASGSDDDTIMIWDLASGHELPTLMRGYVRALAWSPDGRSLACGTDDFRNSVEIMDMAGGRELPTIKLYYQIKLPELDSVTAGNEPRKLMGHTDPVYTLAWSPDGRSLASGSLDKNIKIWDSAAGRELRSLTGHTNCVKALAWSPDGRCLASGSADNSIRIWDAASWRELHTITGSTSVNALAWSPDGRSLASANGDNSIKIWDSTGRELRNITGHTGPVYALAYSPDGRRLASASSDKTIKIWTLAQDDVLCQYLPMTREERIKLDAQKMDAELLTKTKAAAAAMASEEQRLADEAEMKKMAQQQVAHQTRQQVGVDEATSHGTDNTSLNSTVLSNKQSLDKNSTDRPIRDKWAVVVGVSRFIDPTIPPLKYSAKDACDFYNYLITKGNFKSDHVRLLTDEKATRERILTEIGDTFLPHVVGRDDLVVLYFATHGSGAEHDVRRSNFLVAHDTKKTRLYADGIEMQKLLDQLEDRTHADRVLIVLDACHSGGADPNSRALGDSAGVLDIGTFAIGRGHIILSSSQSDELSWESKRYPNGVFTRQLIECLSKNSGVLSSFEQVKDVVSEEVRQSFGVSQTPRLKTDGWEGKELRISLPATKPVTITADVTKLLEPDSKGMEASKAPANVPPNAKSPSHH